MHLDRIKRVPTLHGGQNIFPTAIHHTPAQTYHRRPCWCTYSGLEREPQNQDDNLSPLDLIRTYVLRLARLLLTMRELQYVPFAASRHSHNSFAIHGPREVAEGYAGETDDVYPSSAHSHDQKQRHEKT